MLIVDYLAVTQPEGSGCLADGGLLDLLVDAGFEAVSGVDGLFEVQGDHFRGTARMGVRGFVDTFSVSGLGCEALRRSGGFQELLWRISDAPHRVTRLDVACDLLVPAAPIVASVRRRAERGQIRLTHKPLGEKHRRYIIGPKLYPDASPLPTGTAYLGGKGAEVQAVVYDKRQEQIMRGAVDPGDWCRFELKARGGVGLSLRDVAEPGPVFAHYMRGLMAPFHDLGAVPAWVPGGVGYDLLRPTSQRTPMEILKRRVENSSELAMLIDLAKQCGPYGPDMLAELLATRIRAATRTGSDYPVTAPLLPVSTAEH